MIVRTLDIIIGKIQEIDSIFDMHNANQLREMPKQSADRVRTLRKEVTELSKQVAESMKEMDD
jgi:hypothetical protein